MIYSVQGTLIHVDPHFAVISCGGVGFRLLITMHTARSLPAVGQEAMLYTILNVREDALELYGFADQAELTCFKQLTSISGVGPKMANAILSELSPDKVAMAVAAGDHKTLSRAQGVGAKIAQRIILEMKDKVGVALTSGETGIPAGGIVSASGNAEQAVKALAVLGFTAGEASAAVAKLDSTLSVEEMVKAALKSLARR